MSIDDIIAAVTVKITDGFVRVEWYEKTPDSGDLFSN